MPLLKERMRVTPAPPAKIAQLAADLDSGIFTMRQQAAQTLEKMGESAEGGVRKILEGTPTLEVRRRLSQFLERREKEILRKLRAIEVLDLIATPEARQVLGAPASRAGNPMVREAAELALKRVGKKSAP